MTTTLRPQENTAGATPTFAFSAEGGSISGNGAQAMFRCTTEGWISLSMEATRAGCVHLATAEVSCFDESPNLPDAGSGSNNGSPATACTTVNCAAQLDACKNDLTSGDCQANLDCSNVGATSSCATTSSLDCFCGSRSTAACLASGGNGPCADVITRTPGCDGPTSDITVCVTERFLDVSYGLGDAYQLVACQRRACAIHCAMTP